MKLTPLFLCVGSELLKKLASALEVIFDPPFVCEFQSRAAAHATAFYEL